MNRGTEDYVKAIYKLQQRIEPEAYVSNNSLGAKLGHTAQTVNEMIKKLVVKGYVDYTRYKGTHLTTEGVALAVSMLRKHRLWELFLVKELGYSWESVHEEAEKLEHVTSSVLEAKLFSYLGKPNKCPHGSNIPNLEGEFEKERLHNLTDSKVKGTYRLSRVSDDKELLIYLDKMGFSLGDTIQIIEIDQLNETYHINKKGKTYTFGLKVAKKIYLEEV